MEEILKLKTRIKLSKWIYFKKISINEGYSWFMILGSGLKPPWTWVYESQGFG